MSEFDKVIGYKDIKAELIRYADVLKNPEKYSKLGVALPSGLMICGEPGLGKSLMAKCLIAESGCKVFTLRKDKPNGDFVNLIKETYDNAKKESKAIVFLDDIDKYANEDTMHRDAEEYVAVQACIDECKGHDVFSLATANDQYCMPDSLLRAGRFDKVIEVEAPEGKDAEAIIRHFMESKQMVGEVDVEEISMLMEHKSCAELETVINEAGIYAGFKGKEKIDQEDIVKACMRLLFNSPESTDSFDADAMKSIAIHEAGHAVVAEVLNPGSVTLVSICKHWGTIEGITKTHSPKHFYSHEELERKATEGLGGKAAIEMTLGVQDTGCYEDLNTVYAIVADFIERDCAMGFEACCVRDPSNYLLERRDRLIAAEVEKRYQCAKKIIAENRGLLDAIVEALMDHKTVTYREMQEIKNRVGA